MVHHFVEDWLDVFLGESWVGHTNDTLEVVASENGLLLLNVTEFLVLNNNLTIRLGAVASTQSNIIGHEVACKGS